MNFFSKQRKNRKNEFGFIFVSLTFTTTKHICWMYIQVGRRSVGVGERESWLHPRKGMWKSRAWFIDSCLREPCCCLAAQSCLTLSDRMDCSLPGFSAHGAFQTRILGCVTIFFSRGSSHPQGSNPSLLHCRWIPHHLSHWREPGASLTLVELIVISSTLH